MARQFTPDNWHDLLLRHVGVILASGPEVVGSQYPSGLVFPGAFNPLHVGHRRMAAIAARLQGRAVEFEISIAHVDKPALDYREAVARVSQFAEGETLWLTRAPTFVDKAWIFPGATFVVGADTLARISDPVYYDGNEAKYELALEHFSRQNCHFLVFGRMLEGRFQTLDQLAIPPSLRDLCEAVPEEVFRWDISSTQLRRNNNFNQEGNAKL